MLVIDHPRSKTQSGQIRDKLLRYKIAAFAICLVSYYGNTY